MVLYYQRFIQTPTTRQRGHMMSPPLHLSNVRCKSYSYTCVAIASKSHLKSYTYVNLVRYSRPGSFQVVEISTNRKAVYATSYWSSVVISMHIVYHFQDMTICSSKMSVLSPFYPPHHTVARGVPWDTAGSSLVSKERRSAGDVAAWLTVYHSRSVCIKCIIRFGKIRVF